MKAEDYLESRLQDQIDWYSKKSQSNQKYFKLLRLTEFILAAMIPFLGVLSQAYPAMEGSSLLLMSFTGVLIAVITGAVGLYRFQENWMQYRAAAEGLKREKYFYLTRTAWYRGIDDEDALTALVERVETILGEENQQWVQLRQQEQSQ